jgi:exodeoxyribonuclease V alpha subunit
MGQLEKIYGTVEEIVFRNDDTGFGVVLVDSGGDMVNAAGNLPFIVVGESVCLHGNWTEHPRYGKQFTCEYYEPHFEKNAASIYKYLSSGVVKGLGSATAKKIVDLFGDETLSILELSPERLTEVQSITMQRAMNIHKEYMKKIEIQNVVTYFVKYGVSASIAVRVFNALGGMAIKLCNENPYIICERVDNIGFLTADKVAYEMGVPKNSGNRVRAGILYELSRQAMEGHTCYPKNRLIEEAAKTLDVQMSEVENQLTALLMDGKLKLQAYNCPAGALSPQNGPIGALEKDCQSYIFLPHFYNAENYIAGRLAAVSSRECEDWNKEIDVNEVSAVELSDEQKDAVAAALKNNTLIITGGPGTGKTTVIKSLISAFSKLKKKIILAAPTGRAAKRISEVTGYPAKTIHRLLEFKYINGRQEFVKNERSPVECDIIIIDEMSMTDALLFEAVLRALREKTRIIMVGDCDQLPSVGAGNVLRDMLAADIVKKVSFKKIFRQNDTSKIVENAHKILDGVTPDYNTGKTDFFFVYSESAETANDAVKDLLINRLPGFLNIESAKIQVLTPMRKGNLGCVVLNNNIKSVINPVITGDVQKQANGYIFSKGDRVMQTKNDYEIEWSAGDGVQGEGIFNGDMGVVQDIDMKNAEMTILFDEEKTVKYEFVKLENLELAYAITVHKSQGSEFDAVILPLVYGYSKLMTRNLLYTAVTRAKSFICVVGRKECVKAMIDNNIELKRYTGLRNMLKNELLC